MVLSLSGSLSFSPFKCISESEDLLHIQAYSMLREAEIFRSFTTEATYREGRIITQKTISEELNNFITGHADGGVASNYSIGLSLEIREDALNSLPHPYLKKLN